MIMKFNKEVCFSCLTKKTWTQSEFFKIFCALMFTGICIFLLSLFVFGFENWKGFLFLGFDKDDFFMDFFNPISYAASFDLSYIYWHSIYPPLPSALGTFFAGFFPQELLNHFRAFGLRSTGTGIAMLVTFFVISITGLLALLYRIKEGDVKVKTLFCTFILISFPLLYWFERANNIIFALIFSLFFVAFYNSPKKIIKHLSLFLLAIAINIKIYPFVFGILLLRNKKFKDILYLGLYTIILFFLPFIFVGHIDSLSVYIQNLIKHSNWFMALCCGFGTSLENIFITLFAALTTVLPSENLLKTFSGITLFAGFYGVFASYFVKDFWKVCALLSLLIILIPQTSGDYCLLFMLIPLVFFLNLKEYTFKDLIYLVLFTLIFMLNIPTVVPIYAISSGYPITINNLLAKLSCLVMFIMLCLEGTRSFMVFVSKYKFKEIDLNKQIDWSWVSKKTWTQKQFFKLFCYIMFGGICLFLFSLLVLGFERWVYLFHLLIDPNDSFMDFFNPIYWVQFKEVYSVWDHSNYLPFSYLIFILFSYVIPHNILSAGSVAVRSTIYGSIALYLFLCCSLIPLVLIILKNKVGPVKEKIIFLFLVFFSAPFIFSVQRGNIIFIALFFMMFFVFYYDSKKRYLRELSLLFLACAAVIKIYPAAVGILLLRDKRYKDIFVVCVYVFCLGFLPFFYYNGIGDIKLFFDKVLSVSQKYDEVGYGYIVNIYVTLKMIVYAITNREFVFLNTIFHYIPYLSLLIGFLGAYFVNKKWKAVSIACLLMILVPSISFTYVLLFMIPPLILFLNDVEEKNFKDLIYLFLFCLIFMLNIPALAPIFQPRAVNIILMDNFCARLACLVMFCMLCYDGIADFRKHLQLKR